MAVFGLGGLATIATKTSGTSTRSTQFDIPGVAPLVGPGPHVQTPEEDRSEEERLRAAIAAKTLSNAAKDPETVDFKSVIGHADGTICFDYRAKNSFNAMLKGSAVLLPKGNMLVEERDGNAFVREWNRHCTARGTQIVDVVNLMLGKHV